ncbi:MAG: manganese efflux pump [Spirochaetales bacterium]|nr:manganese efflux pump [Spirochaetales bacterium]
MDALAVSVANGFSIKKIKLHQALRIALAFGLFQAAMPVVGWALGMTFTGIIQSFDHWIVFGLLSIIGAKMIYESFHMDKSCQNKNCLHFPTLLLLSLATSIDALAAGLSFAIIGMRIMLAVLIIGGVTALLCFAGVYIGNRIGHFFENKLEFTGGIILIAIGAKILIEHLLLHECVSI